MGAWLVIDASTLVVYDDARLNQMTFLCVGNGFVDPIRILKFS